MTHEKLVEHLANEASKRVAAGLHKCYRDAIRFVSGGSHTLMAEVGSALGTRSAVKRAIASIKRREAAEKNSQAKQLTLF